MQQILDWIAAHPMLVWPILTGLLSFGLPWLEKRFPTLAGILRASGLDAAGIIKLLRQLLTGSK